MDAEKIVLLLLGWLLGLLSPVIAESIKHRRETKLARTAIASELRELGTTLSLAAYIVRSDQGNIDRPFLQWLKADLEANAVDSEAQAFIPAIRTFLALPDEQLPLLRGHLKSAPSKGPMLQRYAAPLLDSRVSALHSFETSYQRSLLEIHRNLALLDDLVDRSRKYFDLTFTKLESANYQLVSENFEQACALYAKRAESVVRLIRKLPAA